MSWRQWPLPHHGSPTSAVSPSLTIPCADNWQHIEVPSHLWFIGYTLPRSNMPLHGSCMEPHRGHTRSGSDSMLWPQLGLFRPGLAQKPRLWPGLRGLWLWILSGQAKAIMVGLAPAWLGPGRGFCMMYDNTRMNWCAGTIFTTAGNKNTLYDNFCKVQTRQSVIWVNLHWLLVFIFILIIRFIPILLIYIWLRIFSLASKTDDGAGVG